MLASVLMFFMLFWTWAKVQKFTRTLHFHLLTSAISDWKTSSTVQTDEIFVTSSSQTKKAKSRFQCANVHRLSPPTMMSPRNPYPYKNGITTSLVTKLQTIQSRSQSKIEGSLSGFPLALSSISLPPEKASRIRSLGSFDSGQHFPRSS